jgi:hypothetical protein
VSRRRLALVALVLVVAAACTTRYIKLPAEEFLVRHWKERLWIQDETKAARDRCKVVRAALLAPGTQVPVVLPTPEKLEAKRVKCDELDARMKAYEAWDLVVIRASLRGDTIDPEQLEAITKLIGPILGLVKDILL